MVLGIPMYALVVVCLGIAVATVAVIFANR